MEKNTRTIFISLAGVGGCSVSRALRSLGQNALPFDWLIARQDFVISAIETGGKSLAAILQGVKKRALQGNASSAEANAKGDLVRPLAALAVQRLP